MHNRIKQVRKAVHLSQEKFAEKMGLTGNYIWVLESGKRSIPDRVIQDICRVYSVSYDWLMTGEGKMFDEVSDTAIDALVAAYQLDSQDKKIITSYLSLNPKEREIIKNLIKSMVK